MTTRVRILHAHSGNIFGGVESILLSLVRHRAHSPALSMEFALCFEDRLSRELRELGARVHSLCPVRFSRPWTILRARRALAELIEREGYDVVVVHSGWSHALFGPVARRCGARLVWWLHNRTQGTHWTERWARWTRPDLMLCVSRSTAETTPRLFRAMQAEVVYAPHPLLPDSWPADHAARVRSEFDTRPDDAVIIQVSRMEAWKGHVVHLEALAGLKDVPGWVCWQVGGPGNEEESRYYRELQARTKALGLEDRVRFLGRRSDVPRLLAAADLFCQPNLDSEGLSIAFMEAFLARLPIVTSALGGALEFIDESSGMLLPAGDVGAVRTALRRLIMDQSLRQQMGRSARDRVIALCGPAQQLAKLQAIFVGLAGHPVPDPLSKSCRSAEMTARLHDMA